MSAPKKTFTGLNLEPHALSGREVCVAYRDGERVGVLYFDAHRLRLVFEEDEQVWIERRAGPMEFERVWEQEGKQ
jgi:hypothetical protein